MANGAVLARLQAVAINGLCEIVNCQGLTLESLRCVRWFSLTAFIFRPAFVCLVF